MELLIVFGIVTMLAVLVAAAKHRRKRRSSKPLGSTRITPTLASKVIPVEVEPTAAGSPWLTDQPPKSPPSEGFRKEQALLAACQGRLARSQLLLILDNDRRLGLSAEEVSVFESALKTASQSLAKAQPERFSNPKPASNKETQEKPPQEERAPYTTYVPHNSPPLVVQAEKRKPRALPLAKGRVEGFFHGRYRAWCEPIPPLVKPQAIQEWKIANAGPVSGAVDTNDACRSGGESLPSNHELQQHSRVLISTENRESELPCGGCGCCYTCRYLRITRGE